MQSLHITTETVSSNPAHDEVYSIQLDVITFVSDLWQVGGFLPALRFPPQIKLAIHDITEILLQANSLVKYLSKYYQLDILI